METAESYDVSELELFTHQTVIKGKSGVGKTTYVKQSLERIYDYLIGKSLLDVYVLDNSESYRDIDGVNVHTHLDDFLGELLSEFNRRILMTDTERENESHLVIVIDSLNSEILEDNSHLKQLQYLLNNTHLLGVTVLVATQLNELPHWLLNNVDNTIELT